MTRTTSFLIAAPAGVCLVLTAAVFESPALARQAGAAVGIESPMPTAKFSEASGEGRLMTQTGTLVEYRQFEPRHAYAYAYGRGYNRKFRLILTAKSAADLHWRNVDVADLIRDWSQARQAPFVMVELDDKYEPSRLVQSAGDGQFESNSLTIFNGGLRSIDVTFEINDGTRLRGRLRGGDGNCGGRYCDPQMDYTFDVTVIE